jgi:hypothetical protein
MFSITMASLFPVASITYSLTYAMTNKKRIKRLENMDALRKSENNSEVKRAGTIMESLLEMEDEFDMDEERESGGKWAPTGGYTGNVGA